MIFPQQPCESPEVIAMVMYRWMGVDGGEQQGGKT